MLGGLRCRVGDVDENANDECGHNACSFGRASHKHSRTVSFARAAHRMDRCKNAEGRRTTRFLPASTAKTMTKVMSKATSGLFASRRIQDLAKISRNLENRLKQR